MQNRVCKGGYSGGEEGEQMKPGFLGFYLFFVGALMLVAVHVIYTTQAMDAIFSQYAVLPPIYDYVARLVTSAILSVAALYIILSRRYAPQDKHWAYGTIGTVLGFWLRG
jgi:hypothetical protein